LKANAKKPTRKVIAPTSKVAAPKQEVSTLDFAHRDQATFAPEDIMAIQRMVGNQAVQRLIEQARPQAAAHDAPAAVRKPALSGPPFDKDMPAFASYTPQNGVAVQRRINKLPGKSSGFFRKGHRDNINALVDTYNTAEAKLADAKPTLASVRALIPEIQKIWNDANAWHIDVMKKSPEKAAAIRQWMTSEVEREEDTKRVQVGELEAAAALKAASDGASYDVRYTGREFVDYTAGAGVRWLQTPALALIYKYFMIQQLEETTVNAFDDLAKYRLSPSREEALRLFKKYQMESTALLNISGEGLGGRGGDLIRTFRATIAHLESHPDDPVPPNFGPVEQSVHHVINMMFTTFANTEPFRKVTRPPEAKST
jgi:hypothetical protein